ncbi:MAG: choice-of-anchor M domain-containing protein [Pirellulales bacterium]
MIHRVFIACAVCVMSFAIGSANSADYELDLHLHSEEVTPAEFGAGDALLPVVAAAKEIRPADSALDFIGVTSGSSFWLLPKNQNPDVLFLSIGTEELNPADFASSLTWSLVTVTGSGGGAAPGYFSVWNSNSGSPWFSGVVPLMSTAPGASTPGSLTVAAGAHSHFNYGFTEPGLYNITFAASGTLSPALGGGLVSGLATYSFGVFDAGADYQFPASTPWNYGGQSYSVALVGNEHIDMGIGLAVVPEPATGVSAVGALAVGCIALARRRGRQGLFFRRSQMAG